MTSRSYMSGNLKVDSIVGKCCRAVSCNFVVQCFFVGITVSKNTSTIIKIERLPAEARGEKETMIPIQVMLRMLFGLANAIGKPMPIDAFSFTT